MTDASRSSQSFENGVRYQSAMPILEAMFAAMSADIPMRVQPVLTDGNEPHLSYQEAHKYINPPSRTRTQQIKAKAAAKAPLNRTGMRYHECQIFISDRVCKGQQS
jgi:hypothetical protein